MINVDQVFTSRWVASDKVRDQVKGVMESLGGFSEAQIASVVNALDTSVTNNFAPSSPFADFQHNAGVVIPDVSSCLSIAAEAYKAALGDDIDTTTETHVGRMIEQTGKILSSALGITAANIMQHDINSANGRYLDAIASWFFESRKSGLKSSRQATLKVVEAARKKKEATASEATANNPTQGVVAENVIPVEGGDGGESDDEATASLGTTITNEFEAAPTNPEEWEPVTITPETCFFVDGNGVKFSLSEETQITAGDGWRKLCVFEAEDVGEIEINDAGLEWTLQSEVELVAKGSDVVGYDIEGDDAFRNRLKVVRSKAVAFMEAVNTSLYSIVGMYDAYVGENCDTADAEIGSLPVKGHSIVAVISYDGTNDTRNAIAKALYSHKAVGCGYTNLKEMYDGLSPSEKSKYPYLDKVEAEEVQYADPFFGTVYTVTFNRPAIIPFGVKVSVTRYHYSGSNLEQEIRDAISSWAGGNVPFVDGLKIGQDIKAFELGAAISEKIPDIQIDGVLITEIDSSTGEKKTPGIKISLPSYAVGQVSVDDIEVEIN